MKKKLLLSLMSISAVTVITALVACAPNVTTPVEPEPKRIKEATGIFEKRTIYNKPYIKLTTIGYNRFTFSNWYWSYWNNFYQHNEFYEIKDIWEKEGKTFPEEDVIRYFYSAGLSGKFVAKVAKKDQWEYESNKAYNARNGVKYDKAFIEDFSIQKSFPSYQKSISLVKNESDLKKELRLEEDDQKVYENYLERYYKKVTDSEKLTNFDYKKFLPFSDSFNLETIKSKLDFEKYDYIFLKDFWSFLYTNVYFETMHSGVWELDGGIELGDFKIDPKEKKIKIGLYIPPKKSNEKPRKVPDRLPAADIWNEDPRLNSFLVPIEKGKIDTFDLNDYNLWIL
ncbi:hypothetical protein [Mycoplasmopsis agassizii]|nr:hypothetical protein [Mycoplasmopsis agassizii]